MCKKHILKYLSHFCHFRDSSSSQPLKPLSHHQFLWRVMSKLRLWTSCLEAQNCKVWKSPRFTGSSGNLMTPLTIIQLVPQHYCVTLCRREKTLFQQIHIKDKYCNNWLKKTKTGRGGHSAPEGPRGDDCCDLVLCNSNWLEAELKIFQISCCNEICTRFASTQPWFPAAYTSNYSFPPKPSFRELWTGTGTGLHYNMLLWWWCLRAARSCVLFQR